MSKKSRGPNFCTNEKEILIKLIKKHKNIVENKKTDAVTTALKNEGWKVLTEEFNALSSFNVRNTDQLKTCWDNLKRTSRKEKATTKKDISLTGEGRPNNPPTPSLQEQIEVLLDPTLDGLSNAFDSDSQFKEDAEIMTMSNKVDKSFEDVKPANAIDPLYAMPGCANVDDNTGSSRLKCMQPEVEVLIKQENDDTSCLEVKDKDKIWNGWSPAAVKTKMSDALATKKKDNPSWLHRRRPKASMADNLITKKIELVEILKKNALIEAEKKKILFEEQLKQEKIKTELLQLQLFMAKQSNNNHVHNSEQ